MKTMMKKTLKRRTRDTVPDPNCEAVDILETLESIGVRPFRPETVQNYKNWALGRLRLRMRIAAALIVIFSVGLFFTVLSPWFWLGLLTLPVAIVCFVIAANLVADVDTSGWFTNPLMVDEDDNDDLHYGVRDRGGALRRLPPFAITTMQSVKAVIPTARWGVEYLQKDPFLVLITREPHYGRYYLEVWNEPAYIQKRLV